MMRKTAMSGLIFRLPTYLLPLVMGFIEWSLRRVMHESTPMAFLPATIVSVGLGMLSSIIVNDLPYRTLSVLSIPKQQILRLVSGLSLIWMLTGLALWFELVLMTIQAAPAFGLPDILILDLNAPLSYSALFYLLCLLFNEIKAGVSL
jgi:hypothetical protein